MQFLTAVYKAGNKTSGISLQFTVFLISLVYTL